MSYYLPITAKRKEDNTWDIQWDYATRSPIPNLRLLMEEQTDHVQYEMNWIGWPRVFVPEEEQDEFQEQLDKYNCHAVFLSEDVRESYFNGFCKGILWPLFHYRLPTGHHDFATRWEGLWQKYILVNTMVSHVTHVASV